jgi:hypothetical protein
MGVRRLIRLGFSLGAMVWLFGASLWAQLPTTTFNGIVTDPQGAAVAGARVAITSKATGTMRETVTGSEGQYVVTNLDPGRYDVRIEAKGMSARDYPNVQLEVGRVFTLDISLTVAAIGQQVIVSEVPVGVELTQSTVENQITSSTVESMPLNGRNFLELAFLLPGNRPAVNYDPTKTNTLEVSSAGQFGRGGNISVDGGDNNDEVVGGTLANFPEDAVQEFQIATNRYTAEVGRSGSSIINIISKSGTNEYHGSAFIYERNRNLQGLPATFNRAQPTPPFDRQQYGGSVGGPIKKERAWWFFSYERRHQNADAQTALRDFAADSIVTSSSAAPLRDNLLLGKLDFRFTDKDAFFVRYAWNKSTEIGPGSLQDPIGTAANFQNSTNKFHSVATNWTHTFSGTKVNSLTYHFDNFINFIGTFPPTAMATTDVPIPTAQSHELVFPSVEDGPNFRVPQRTRLNDRHQIRDTFAWTMGRHTLHFGGEWQRFGSDVLFDLFGSGSIFLAQDFAKQDLNGDGVINDLDIPIAAAVVNSAAAGVLPHAPFDFDNYVGFFVQDDWRIRPNLTLNLGLRWELDTDIFGTDSNLHKPCPEPLSTAPTSPCIWLRTALGLTHRSPDWNDWGPRVGFAWDPFKKGETVIRGGYGLYYDRVILEVKILETLVDGRRLGISGLGGSTCGGTSAGCSAPGARFDPGTPTLANPLVGAPAALGIGLNALANNITHPMVHQGTLGIQQQVGQNWVLSADGIINRGSRFLIGRTVRDFSSAECQVGANRVTTCTDPLTGIPNSIQDIASQANTWYDGLLVSAQRRPVIHGPWSYGFNLNYTLSKSLNESNDDQIPFGVGDQADLRFGINNDLALEKGYASTDERHRFVFFGLFTVPGKVDISPIWTVSSPIPGNPLVAGQRFLGLRRNALAREVHNSTQLNAAIAAWDALSPCPPPGPGVTLPCRLGGVLNPVAPGLHFGSWFDSWDTRVSRTFTIAERHNIELIGEVFNLFNITNIRGSNRLNYFGFANDITQPNFNQRLVTAGGFFGSGGPRAFQFAVRYSF